MHCKTVLEYVQVLLFARRAQDSYVEGQKVGVVDRPGIYLGMHQTDGTGALGPIEVPPDISTVPGHYNVTALLPQDNTFAKGSLYILAPGTQCVVMDMDGTLTVRPHPPVSVLPFSIFF